MGNIENSYDLIDFNGRLTKSFSNKYSFKNHDVFSIENENIFYRYNNQLFKKEVYSDTVYMYENEDFKPHLVIQVGKKLMTPQVRSEYDGLEIIKDYIMPLKLFEFGEYIYYEFTYNLELNKDRIIYRFIGSKENNSII